MRRIFVIFIELGKRDGIAAANIVDTPSVIEVGNEEPAVFLPGQENACTLGDLNPRLRGIAHREVKTKRTMRAAAVSGQLITVLGWRQQERTAVKFKRNAYFDRACADICKERLGADLQRIWGNRIAERIIKRELEAVLFVFKDGYVGWRNLDLIEPIGQLRAGNRRGRRFGLLRDNHLDGRNPVALIRF